MKGDVGHFFSGPDGYEDLPYSRFVLRPVPGELAWRVFNDERPEGFAYLRKRHADEWLVFVGGGPHKFPSLGDAILFLRGVLVGTLIRP